ncbi:hypothetical protein KTE28_10405 [Burkholderia multivorans]|uniref:hypothetical protein n=1 Tax=Burkholderia multivorans TaxID=87883 RepID=UPI000B258EEB|nr:hypothetical protein [Burkholderia multivorans]MBU9374749.1 hypothetical protein [Burkholderia multivorans]MBU9477132.1 hypothetical protein [Burkholderia multivorans]
MQGIIYRIEQPIKTLQLNLPLEGKYFLRPVHSSTMTSTRRNGNDPLVFRFFSGSNRAALFCFCPIDSLSEAATRSAWGRAIQLVEQGTHPDEVGRFVWSNNTAGTTINDISLFLRGTGTLTEDSYSTIARLRVTVDAKGMAILSSEPGGDRAGRALAAYMLGLAYHRVLEQAIHDLAECCRDDKKVKRTEAMHSEISRFIAGYYFDAPARVFTTEVGPLYAAIRNRLLLPALRRELVDQLGQIAEIIRMERTEAESAFETKLQRRFTLLGAFIGILGLAQLTQTTPAQIETFTAGWKAVFSGNPAMPASPSDPQKAIAKQLAGRSETQPHRTRRIRTDAQSATR